MGAPQTLRMIPVFSMNQIHLRDIDLLADPAKSHHCHDIIATNGRNLNDGSRLKPPNSATFLAGISPPIFFRHS
jgi:hypothetical protein